MNELLGSEKQIYVMRVFWLLFVSYLVLILYPILHADRYCNDDLIRSVLGNYGWNNNGRHLANLFMRILQFGSPRMIDIWPLPQVLAVAVLAWTGALVARRFSIQQPWLAALVVFPLGAQPFYLENLSYRFDAPCMALAVMCALLPFTILGSNWKHWSLGVLALLACLSFYQPAINVFLIFAILEAFLAQVARERFLSQATTLLRRASQALVASLIYQWVFAGSMKDWMHEHGALIWYGSAPDRLIANTTNFYHYVIDAFSARWEVLFTPFAIVAVATPIAVSLYLAWSQRADLPRWQTATLIFAAFALPCAAAICIAGPMLLLERPILMPRVMIGIGGLLCAALIAMHATFSRMRWTRVVQSALAGVWALGFVVVACAYGNTLGAQKSYETHIASRISDDIATASALHPVHSYLLAGSAGFAPVAEHTISQLPIMRDLVSPYLQQNDFNSRNFLLHYLPNLVDLRTIADASKLNLMLAKACDAPILFTRAGYTLRVVEESAILDFSRAPGLHCEVDSTAH